MCLGADEDPVDALVLKDRDEPFAEGHLGWEEAARHAGAGPPCLVVERLVELDFLANGRFIEEREQRMMEGEDDDIGARVTARRRPAPRLPNGTVPVRLVTELSGAAEADHVLDESTRVRDLGAGLAVTAHCINGVAGSVLIGGDAVRPGEDLAEVVLGVRSTAVLAEDGLPRSLVPVDADALIRPVDGLLEVP
jgi:hypothetical protein